MMREEFKMLFLKAKVSWYSEYDETDKIDYVAGFAKNVSKFTEKLDEEFSNISDVQIEVVNSWATETQLIYLPNDPNWIATLVEENNY